MPAPIAHALRTLLQGALLGIGAAVGLGGVYLMARPAIEVEMHHQLDEVRATFEPSAADIALS